MPDSISQLLLEFLAYVSYRQRTYAEVMDAWRSTCPRHTVWEDSLLDGLIQVQSVGARQEALVSLTARGRSVLCQRQDLSAPADA
jgi:hypothetical protein